MSILYTLNNILNTESSTIALRDSKHYSNSCDSETVISIYSKAIKSLQSSYQNISNLIRNKSDTKVLMSFPEEVQKFNQICDTLQKSILEYYANSKLQIFSTMHDIVSNVRVTTNMIVLAYNPEAEQAINKQLTDLLLILNMIIEANSTKPL